MRKASTHFLEGPWGHSKPRPQPKQADNGSNDFFREWWQNLFPGGKPPQSSLGIPLWLWALGLLILYVTAGFYRIEPSERGLVLRFGRVVRESSPGLNWHIPWPVETVIIRNVTRVQKTESGVGSTERQMRAEESGFQRALLLKESGISEHTMLTRDANLVEVNFSVLWTIKDIYAFLFGARDPGRTVKDLAESVVREIVAQTPISLVLAEGRSLVNQKAQESLQKLTDYYGLGIHIQEVMMGRIDPPSQVRDAYRDVQRAKADEERMVNEAEAYKNALIPEKRAYAAQILRKAEGEQAKLVAEARARTTPFLRLLEEYRHNPAVVSNQMIVAATAKILKEKNKVLISGGAAPLLPFLNLSEKKHLSLGAKDTSLSKQEKKQKRLEKSTHALTSNEGNE